MKAGVAKAVITPDKPLIITNGPVATGKLTEIYARALVLNDGEGRLVIITYDLNCLGSTTDVRHMVSAPHLLAQRRATDAMY